jgi:hypothetical protein
LCFVELAGAPVPLTQGKTNAKDIGDKYGIDYGLDIVDLARYGPRGGDRPGNNVEPADD